MGWRSSYSRAVVSKCRYYNRLIKMESTRLPKMVFQDLKTTPGTWANEMLNILNKLDEGQNWHKNIPVDLSLIERKIAIQDTVKWEAEVKTKRKLDFFQEVKTDMEVSSFIKCNLPKRARSLISRLRNGSLMLRLEYGRYIRLPREERICEMCNEGVEDAYHFLYWCPKLSACRMQHSELIESGNVLEHPFKLGRMICDLWNERQQIMSQL